jgi:tRNA U34 5-methylaminomethyl-2-thiouridine-forming methyltransferase MnmC
MEPQITQDGSYTFYSEEFQQTFHSHFGAKQEAITKYVFPTKLATLSQQRKVRILDFCYGLGYNTAAAIEAIWLANPTCHIEVIALEINPEVPLAAVRHNLLADWLPPIPDLLAELARSGSVKDTYREGKIDLTALWGDARQTIQTLADRQYLADAIFFDPFSPPQCPELWTIELFAIISQCCAPMGRLATYSCAASVRNAIRQAGFKIGATPPVGRKTPGTIACLQNIDLPPLSQMELEHLQTRASIPYRDPFLKDDRQTILDRRETERLASNLESTSRWKSRWTTH